MLLVQLSKSLGGARLLDILMKGSQDKEVSKDKTLSLLL